MSSMPKLAEITPSPKSKAQDKDNPYLASDFSRDTNMSTLIIRIMIAGLLFCGCTNPFSSKGYSPILGIWGAVDVTAPIQSIAFLSKGRYFENDVHVGAYALLEHDISASGFENAVFNHYTVRIDYIRGERLEVVVTAVANNTIEISIRVTSGRGGPFGDYHKLHTGDGL